MATSGRINSGSFNSSYFYFQWQLSGQSVAGNYSTINWQWGLNTSSGAYWLSNAVKSVSGYIDGGLVFGANTWSNISGNGDHQLLAGSRTIGHDVNGNKSFAMSSTGWLYSGGNFSNSGSWALPSIARNITIAGTPGNINDESNPYIVYNNPAGHGCTAWLELPALTGSTQYATRTSYVSGANMNLTATERNAIRAVMANTNSTTVRYVTYDTSTGFYSIADSTITIINANPTFSLFAYHDSNGTTSTLTGNDQFIIQNVSTLNVDISSTNKAVALKGASMVSYTASINAVPTNFAYSGSTINQALGTINAATTQFLSVTATDTRGNATTVQKTVTMVPYTAPTLSVTAEREDGFGEDTTIAIAGDFAPITVSAVDKNVVSTSTGIQYKVWAVGDSEPGSYTDVTSSSTAGHTTVSSPPVETLDQDTEFNLKVRITDSVSNTIFTSVIGVGKAAFRIGLDGFLYNENKKILAALDLYPIGSVILSTVNTNPTSVLGGTWGATTTASASILGETMYGFKRTA